MSEPRISVIIPTIGRDTIGAALASCADADEVIVVFDRGHPNAARPPVTVNAQVHGGDHGYTARMKGMSLATGTHLAFLDDDDVYTRGALTAMRKYACDRPVIFRMTCRADGFTLWQQPSLKFGNVGTPMFLVPNDPHRLGEWHPHARGIRQPGGDFTFIRGCVEKMGDPIWRRNIVAKVRPHATTMSELLIA